jgi:hypothetical protein
VRAPPHRTEAGGAPPCPASRPARQMRAAWPWARTPMITAVYCTRPTLACPYKIGLTLFLQTAAAHGKIPSRRRQRPLSPAPPPTRLGISPISDGRCLVWRSREEVKRKAAQATRALRHRRLDAPRRCHSGGLRCALATRDGDVELKLPPWTPGAASTIATPAVREEPGTSPTRSTTPRQGKVVAHEREPPTTTKLRTPTTCSTSCA